MKIKIINHFKKFLSPTSIILSVPLAGVWSVYLVIISGGAFFSLFIVNIIFCNVAFYLINLFNYHFLQELNK